MKRKQRRARLAAIYQTGLHEELRDHEAPVEGHIFICWTGYGSGNQRHGPDRAPPPNQEEEDLVELPF